VRVSRHWRRTDQRSTHYRAAEAARGVVRAWARLIVTAINPGNSGGALANSQERVVGINTAVAGSSGLAVPIDATTLRIVSALMREGRYRRAYLGVAGGPQPLPPRIAKQLGRRTAVQVLQVVDGSSVALAGVQAGDRILDVDGNDRDRHHRPPAPHERGWPAGQERAGDGPQESAGQLPPLLPEIVQSRLLKILGRHSREELDRRIEVQEPRLREPRISEVLFMFTTRKPPRFPSFAQKYAACGFVSSRILAIFWLTVPSRTALLNFSGGMVTWRMNRMGCLLSSG